MAHASITLTMTHGFHKGDRYVFKKPSSCLVGRAGDCDIQVPAKPPYGVVSRHHCLFEINPPMIRVRDLGSRNGTYVNGKLLGQRPRQSEDGPRRFFPACDLRDGDEVQVFNTVFRVETNPSNDSHDSN